MAIHTDSVIIVYGTSYETLAALTVEAPGHQNLEVTSNNDFKKEAYYCSENRFKLSLHKLCTQDICTGKYPMHADVQMAIAEHCL